MARKERFVSTGAAMIAGERERQVTAEGWTPAHDDRHDAGEMIDAARCYALRAEAEYYGENNVTFADVRSRRPRSWPWEERWWKPSDDPIRNLVKAGALIAAEIDRLIRRNAAEDEARAGGAS